MMDYNNLLSKSKVLVLAHAGCGKTHTIAESLLHTTGKSLILTHTHAGVNSIREKIKKLGVENTNHTICTIDSFAQKYVFAFYTQNDIPNQDEDAYYPFILSKATEIFSKPLIQDILRINYTYLFVDEYQDCTTIQHNLIMCLTSNFKTYLFGDPMQGIFNFGKDHIISLETDIPQEFIDNKIVLECPHRWEGKNEDLGRDISSIRLKLDRHEIINLRDYNSINLVGINDGDMQQKSFNSVYNLINKNSEILFITPYSESVDRRLGFAMKYNMSIGIMEANTEKDFYTLAKETDDIISPNNVGKIRDILLSIFKTSINTWISSKGTVIKKTNEKDQLSSAQLRNAYSELTNGITPAKLGRVLNITEKLPGVKCYRRELFFDLLKSLETSSEEKTSVYAAMNKVRNRKAIIGHKANTKCIGTTLLTKGLEYENVAIIDAHKFKDPKNFYVAISRATKKLVIFSANETIEPYKQSS